MEKKTITKTTTYIYKDYCTVYNLTPNGDLLTTAVAEKIDVKAGNMVVVYVVLFFSLAVAVTLYTFTHTHLFTEYANATLTFLFNYRTMDFQVRTLLLPRVRAMTNSALAKITYHHC